MGYTASDAESVLRKKIEETWGPLNSDNVDKVLRMFMHDDVRPHMAEYIRMTDKEWV